MTYYLTQDGSRIRALWPYHTPGYDYDSSLVNQEAATATVVWLTVDFAESQSPVASMLLENNQS